MYVSFLCAHTHVKIKKTIRGMTMKRFKIGLAMLAAVLVLGACGSKKEAATEKDEKKDIKIACNQVSENSLIIQGSACIQVNMTRLMSCLMVRKSPL